MSQREWLDDIAKACEECGLTIRSIDEREVRVILLDNGSPVYVTVETYFLSGKLIRRIFGKNREAE